MDAVTAFRSRLRKLMDIRGRVRLPFSTVREIPLPVGTFFGTEFLANGMVDASRPGLCLDKIKWMKIRLPGPRIDDGQHPGGNAGVRHGIHAQPHAWPISSGPAGRDRE